MFNPLNPDEQFTALHQAAYQLVPSPDNLFKQLERQQVLNSIIDRIRSSLNLDTIFKTTATEIRQLLNADRVGVFRFFPESGYDQGEFVAEEVVEGFTSALATKVSDHCFGSQYAAHYTQGRIQAVADIYDAKLSDCHIKILEQFQVRANLIVPVLKGQELWGLLCIHQCSNPRSWQSSEIEFVKQIANHFAIALQQAEYVEQIESQSEQLKQNLKELQQSQVQLIQNEKMASLGQLVAGIAHEINNPVNFIHGNLGYVKECVTDLLSIINLGQQQDIQAKFKEIDIEFILEDLPKALASMEMGTDRIRQIILSLRNFSRLDEATFKAVNIHEGIDSTLLILGHRLNGCGDQKGVEIIKEYGEIPLIECYPAQLNQVFMNILANAIDAIEEAAYTRKLDANNQANPPAPKIWISTQLTEQDHLEVRIRDNGTGLKEENKLKIFDNFFTTKPVGKGTGLGLAISEKIIVDKHHGKIEVNSLRGQGSEFVINLPIKLEFE